MARILHLFLKIAKTIIFISNQPFFGHFSLFLAKILIDDFLWERGMFWQTPLTWPPKAQKLVIAQANRTVK